MTLADIEKVFDEYEGAGCSGRTINKARELLRAIFNYGCDPRRGWGLMGNPAVLTDRRRANSEPGVRYFEIEQVEAIAQAAAAGRWRGEALSTYQRNSLPVEQEQEENEQLAELIRFAAYTGLRQGELREPEQTRRLDAKLRVNMRTALAQLHSRLATTTVYVTHDQVEAMTLGHRVALLRDGVIQQVDTPQRLYNEPTNVFVAAFIGSPAMNLMKAEIGLGVLSLADLTIPLGTKQLPAGRASGTVTVGLRPQAFHAGDVAPADLPRISVRPVVVEELGSERHIIFPVEAEPGMTRGRCGIALRVYGPRRQSHTRGKFLFSVPSRLVERQFTLHQQWLFSGVRGTELR